MFIALIAGTIFTFFIQASHATYEVYISGWEHNGLGVKENNLYDRHLNKRLSLLHEIKKME